MQTEDGNPKRELAKAYGPKLVEDRWYQHWKSSGYFHTQPDPERPPYCITIPPPNITGSLHMGHALCYTIIDVMTRWHRMRGFCTLTLPGTDHAGIATQSVVDRELAREFERLCTRLLQAEEHKPEAIEIRWSKSPEMSVPQFREALQQLRKAQQSLSAPHALLITAQDMPPGGLEAVSDLAGPDIEIWDRQRLLALLEKHPDLNKEFGARLRNLGREEFVARCWEWREQYGNRIYHQFEKLGCSYDWERVRFTMDPTYVDAIMEEFRQWYERGLIYRGTRVVNWDVKLQSAVSDIEVLTETRAGKLYHFRYPFMDGSGFVTIATTRPETLLGDTAVAANPSDSRYQPLLGKILKLPLTDREIPLIADDYAKPEFGSGAVKVTPAHDLDDFEAGLRHNLPQIVVIGADGMMTEAAGPKYAGLERFEARRRVVADMQALGLLEKVEDYEIQTPISERSGEIIEPLLSEQWFVDMKPLAKPAIDIVHEGKIRFIPERFQGIYLHWMENIRPWCISRQLWWGHRIPVWWTEENGTRRHAFARNREEAVQALGAEQVWQDEDVLDTWFSSALWPHATLGWPHATDDLAYFYPTNLLSTAQEILYLWVARMIMTGLDFIKRPAASTLAADGLIEAYGKTRAIIPFRYVYIHATVLDEKGQRMSKSKGNGIDPLDLITEYGADATRFSLMQQAGKNQDIRFSAQRTEDARNFCNKLWNASRFVLMNLDDATTGQLPPHEKLTMPDFWVLSRLTATINVVNSKFGTYDMDDATRVLYAFVWDVFCDWYLEIAKIRLRAGGHEKETALNVLVFVLDTTLRLLHPIIPFITEEIWQALPHEGEAIMLASYPEKYYWSHPQAELAMAQVIETTRALRNLRAELGIAPGARLSAAYLSAKSETHAALTSSANLIAELARLKGFQMVEQVPAADSGKWVATPITGAEVFLEIGDALDIDKELERIEKELGAVAKEIERAQSKLDNPNFVERARLDIVEEERRRLTDWQEKRAKLEERKRLFGG